MSAWKVMPRAVRRKILETAVKADPANVRAQLKGLKAARDAAAKVLADMDTAIEDTEALLGEVSA